MKQYALIAAACAFTLGASAQTLNKEITVEKDYVPVERKAVKQNALPTVQKNSVDMNAKLNYSDWAVPAEVPAKIRHLLPYGYLTNKDFDTSRGYLVVGAGSQLNIVGSAGYRILDTDFNTLAVWLQHNSTWNGSNSSTVYPYPYDRYTQKFNDNTLGVDFTSHFYEGTLKLNASFNIDNYNYYGLVGTIAQDPIAPTPTLNYGPDEFGKQTFTQFGIGGRWDSSTRRPMRYSVELGIGYGGFSKTPYEEYTGLKETNVRVGLGAKYIINEEMNAGANVKFNFASYNDAPVIDFNTWKVSEARHNSFGIVSISPFYTLHRENLMLQLGANADISFNDGATFRFSPNVHLDYSFTPGAGLFIDLTGGKTINHIATMKALNRYVNPSTAYGSTYVPVDVEAGVNLGSFAGFSAKVFGGFASYKNAQLPFFAMAPATPSAGGYDIELSDLTATTLYQGIDISGWKLGGELNYKFRSLVEANVRFTYSPQKEDEGCILGQDRAKYVLDANLHVTPIDRLSINLGYEMRGDRSAYGYQTVDGADYWETNALNDVLNLKAGASYRLLDKLTLWVEANNLLNKQWDVLYGQGAQKLAVMGGVNLKF